MLRREHLAIGKAGVGQGGIGGRGEAGTFAVGGKAGGFAARFHIVLQNAELPHAVAPTGVLQRHFGSHGNPRFVPLRLSSRKTLAGGIGSTGVAAEEIDFPARLRGELGCGGESGRLLVEAATGIALQIQRWQQRGAGSHLRGAGLFKT